MSYPGQQYHHGGGYPASSARPPYPPPQQQPYPQQQQPYYPQGGGYAPPPGPPGGWGGPPAGGGGGGGGGYGPPPGPPPVNSYSRPQGGGYGGGNDYRTHAGSFNAGGYGGGLPSSGPGHYAPPPGPPPQAIPTNPQHYGPQFQGANGQQQPFFQYSQCTGKRKALLVGINYFGQSSELRGCINDVHNVKNFITSRHNYREDDIVVLTDDARQPRQQPTRANILQAMHWLVQDAQPNDALFFHYSGHGGQAKDLDGDEDDGYDETIYPVDHKNAGQIIDDEMHAIMVAPLQPGVRLTAIFDSCHSGTALDLPYVYSTEGVLKEPNLLKEAGQGLLGAGMSYLRGDIGGLFSGITQTIKQVSGGQSGAVEKARRTKTSPADVIQFSGCKDEQTSADATEAGKATGAMSYAFIQALTQQPNCSYQTLLQNVRAILSSKYSQKPQLSASHPMDVTLQFIL